jgi:hypothetical protein
MIFSLAFMENWTARLMRKVETFAVQEVIDGKFQTEYSVF